MAMWGNMPTDLVLVRHGESEGNLYDDLMKKAMELDRMPLARELQRKLHGRHSSEWRLTDLGRHQAKRAGMLLRDLVLNEGVGFFDTCFCSSYARAMETAAYMDLPNSKYRISVFLREKDSVREWQRSGLSSKASISSLECMDGSAELSKFYGDAAGLESPADLLMRTHLFLHHLQRECKGRRVLVVCHNHVMKAFRIILTGVHPNKIETMWDEVTPNCCVDWYTRRDSSGAVHTLLQRRIVLALVDPKDPEATHCRATREETPLDGSAVYATQLTSDELCEAVRDYPQSLNSQDMERIVVTAIKAGKVDARSTTGPCSVSSGKAASNLLSALKSARFAFCGRSRKAQSM